MSLQPLPSKACATLCRMAPAERYEMVKSLSTCFTRPAYVCLPESQVLDRDVATVRGDFDRLARADFQDDRAFLRC